MENAPPLRPVTRWWRRIIKNPCGLVASMSGIDCPKFFSRSHDAVIRVYDDAGNVIETHEQAGECKEF
jgi:hypothetical protein